MYIEILCRENRELSYLSTLRNYVFCIYIDEKGCAFSYAFLTGKIFALSPIFVYIHVCFYMLLRTGGK